MNLDPSLVLKLDQPLPFLDLFEQLQQAGMQLTMEQYDLLQHALWRQHGLNSWEDLRRVCAILWVKPSTNYDRTLFEREFQRYREDALTAVFDLKLPEQHELVVISNTELPKRNAKITNPRSQIKPGLPQEDVPVVLEQKLPEPNNEVETCNLPNKPVETCNLPNKSVLPKVPPRLMPKLMPDRMKTSYYKGPIGVKSQPDLHRTGRNWKFIPIALPITIPQVQESWRALRQGHRAGIADEVDVERTVERISRLGFLEDVVLRSSWRERAELVVLVDEGDGMVPYLPALKPLFQAIEGGWVTPARIYRFTAYPLRFLYDWQRPTQSEAVNEVLSHLHRTRTIVMVVSDAGAAFGARNDDRVQGTAKFLERWQNCVSQILWVNPVPEARWAGTPAEAIQEMLAGRMISLESLEGKTVRSLIKSVQLGRWG